MDIRTGKVFDPNGSELSQEQIDKLNEEPIIISGDNCVNRCALAHKRGCWTMDRKFRDKCKCFLPQRLGCQNQN